MMHKRMQTGTGRLSQYFTLLTSISLRTVQFNDPICVTHPLLCKNRTFFFNRSIFFLPFIWLQAHPKWHLCMQWLRLQLQVSQHVLAVMVNSRHVVALVVRDHVNCTANGHGAVAVTILNLDISKYFGFIMSMSMSKCN